METINIYGASGHGRVIYDILRANDLEISRFYDDSPRVEAINGIPVNRPSTDGPTDPLIIGIGLNHVRRAIAQRYPHAAYARAVHPSAIVSDTAEIGEGTVVMQGAIVQADVKVGRHAIINTGASLDHDCIVGDFTHISPHATLCGNVRVGDLSWVGAGSVVIPGITIGRNCMIGAGSVVNKDIPDNAVAVGNPVRIVRYQEP